MAGAAYGRDIPEELVIAVDIARGQSTHGATALKPTEYAMLWGALQVVWDPISVVSAWANSCVPVPRRTEERSSSRFYLLPVKVKTTWSVDEVESQRMIYRARENMSSVVQRAPGIVKRVIEERATREAELFLLKLLEAMLIYERVQWQQRPLSRVNEVKGDARGEAKMERSVPVGQASFPYTRRLLQFNGELLRLLLDLLRHYSTADDHSCSLELIESLFMRVLDVYWYGRSDVALQQQAESFVLHMLEHILDFIAYMGQGMLQCLSRMIVPLTVVPAALQALTQHALDGEHMLKSYILLNGDTYGGPLMSALLASSRRSDKEDLAMVAVEWLRVSYVKRMQENTEGKLEWLKVLKDVVVVVCDLDFMDKETLMDLSNLPNKFLGDCFHYKERTGYMMEPVMVLSDVLDVLRIMQEHSDKFRVASVAGYYANTLVDLNLRVFRALKRRLEMLKERGETRKMVLMKEAVKSYRAIVSNLYKCVFGSDIQTCTEYHFCTRLCNEPTYPAYPWDYT